MNVEMGFVYINKIMALAEPTRNWNQPERIELEARMWNGEMGLGFCVVVNPLRVLEKVWFLGGDQCWDGLW